MSDSAIEYPQRLLTSDIEQRVRLSRRPLYDVIKL